ncbi:MAG: ABC transporter permease [Candidatus Heimdallarchaeota archaeon]|nr:ABC transporter permease [Candidatus Heimdallarchaeota archaeon]
MTQEIEIPTVAEEEAEKVMQGIPSVNLWKLVILRIKKNGVAVICFQWIVLMIVIAFFHPVLMGDGPSSLAPNLTRKFGGGANGSPSLRYPFGTQILGMDLFSRVLAGSETSILVGVMSTIISILIGVTLGLIAGYYQSHTEEIIMRITDFFLAIPFLILALVLIQLIRNSDNPFLASLSHVTIITLVIGVFGWAGLTRLVTANTKQVSNMEYVQAARVIGVKDSSIIFNHIFPNILAPIVILAAIFIGGGILSEAGLAFLGFGDPINTISWGIDVNQSREKMGEHPEQALLPGFAIFLLVLSINLLGDALRDALDPRLRD